MRVKLLPRKSKFFCLLLAMSSASLPLQNAHALDLSHTIYGEVGEISKIDPVLLFAVSLGESAYSGKNNQGQSGIRPNAYTLRSKNGPYYSSDKNKAASELNRLLSTTSNVDVGAMQVSWLWHGEGLTARGIKPEDLLDLRTNVEEGAKILNTAMKSVPGDIELGVGRYHNWADEELARNYGQRILAIYRNLKSLR